MLRGSIDDNTARAGGLTSRRLVHPSDAHARVGGSPSRALD